MSNFIFEPDYEILQSLFQNITDALLVYDYNGSLMNVNKAFLNILPIENPEALKNLNLFKDFQLSQSQIDLIKNDTIIEFETQINRMKFISDFQLITDESIDQNQLKMPIDVNLLIRSIKDKYYLVTLFTSIKPKDHSLMIHETQLSLALKDAKITMWDWNLIDNTIFFSENFNHWFDYDISLITSDANALYTIVHPDDIDLLKRQIDNNIINKTDIFSPEFRIKKNDNEYIWIKVTGRYIESSYGQSKHLRGILLNATEEKQNILELESERYDMQNLFNNMNTGFALHKIITDSSDKPIDYEFIYVNPAYELLTGLNKNNIIRKSILDVMPNLEFKFIEIYGDIAINGGAKHFVDYSKPLNKYFDIVVYQTEPNYFAVIFSDVTEAIRAEKALTQADKMNSIGQLAGGIAHDFNNHLQIIRGYSEIMEAKLKDLQITELEEYLDKIQLSVKHSSNMIKQLLAYSKDDHFTGKPMDFHLMLHQTKNILSYTINRNIPIQLLLEAKSYQIIGDDSLIQNAIINMCLNSRDALPNGGLILIMTRNIHYDKSTYVGMTKLVPGDYIICSIRDNGEGIKPDDMKRIFEPFYTTKINKGTGMGLAAVFGTIKHHQGAIDVSSQPGEWTQFDFYLPVSTERVNYSYSSKEHVIDTFVPYNILLVDDEPVITLVMAQFLTEIGHKVTVFKNPSEALSNYINLNQNFDLVLLDVIMPDMNGFDLLEQLIIFDPTVKAIFLSGYFNTNDIKESSKEHILDYIEKPVNLNDLNDKIQRLLRNN